MTIGVGGSTAEQELAALRNLRGEVPPIGVDERRKRIDKAPCRLTRSAPDKPPTIPLSE